MNAWPDESFPSADSKPVPRVVSRADAIRYGYNDAAIARRLRSGRWRRLLPHTYLTVDTLTWNDRLVAALAFAGPRSVLSGAAALHGQLRCVSQPDNVLVLVPYEEAPRSTSWVRIRRAVHPPPCGQGPIRRAPVARAVADLGVEMSRIDDVRALVTEVVRSSHCSVGELADAVNRGPRRESKFLRQAVEEAAGGAWSAPEARAATLMREAGIRPFVQNARIRLPNGRVVFADFYWEELKALLEIDSIEHHDRPNDRESTDERHAVLESFGYSVTHFTPRFVYRQPGAFLDRVQTWLSGRARALNLPR